jgi:ABC-type lipoprotein release transport system permease subunit
VAFRGDHTRYEAPPLASGRRLRTEREAEVGAGLAEALGLHVGGTLAVQLPRGERRWRVAGIVRALDHDGREAWVRPKRLLSAADPSESIAVRLRSPSDAAGVTQRLTALGAAPTRATAATPRGAGFVGTLATLLRAVAVVNALACLHALVQALAMTVRDRRPTLALLRAVGAPPSSVGLVLAAAAAVLALPSAAAGLALERWVLGPLVARHAAGYADLPITTTAGQAAAVVAGACLLAGLAAALVGRNAIRVPIAAGLAEE